jgi:hypothetical protein
MKHIADTDRASENPMRLRQYIAQERRGAKHPNSIALHRRPRQLKATKVRAYLRIDRGIEA